MAGTAIVFLASLGALAARIGGTPVAKSVCRVVVWGTLAMAVTAGVGSLFGTTWWRCANDEPLLELWKPREARSRLDVLPVAFRFSPNIALRQRDPCSSTSCRSRRPLATRRDELCTRRARIDKPADPRQRYSDAVAASRRSWRCTEWTLQAAQCCRSNARQLASRCWATCSTTQTRCSAMVGATDRASGPPAPS